jgi:hypothetical protein
MICLDNLVICLDNLANWLFAVGGPCGLVPSM